MLDKSCNTCKHGPPSNMYPCRICNTESLSAWEPKKLIIERRNALSVGIPEYYNYSYKGLKLDPYRTAEIYGITDNRQFHIFKKTVRLHKENHKSLKTNLKDIISTAERWLEMLEEDENE